MQIVPEARVAVSETCRCGGRRPPCFRRAVDSWPNRLAACLAAFEQQVVPTDAPGNPISCSRPMASMMPLRRGRRPHLPAARTAPRDPRLNPAGKLVAQRLQEHGCDLVESLFGGMKFVCPIGRRRQCSLRADVDDVSVLLLKLGEHLVKRLQDLRDDLGGSRKVGPSTKIQRGFEPWPQAAYAFAIGSGEIVGVQKDDAIGPDAVAYLYQVDISCLDDAEHVRQALGIHPGGWGGADNKIDKPETELIACNVISTSRE